MSSVIKGMSQQCWQEGKRISLPENYLAVTINIFKKIFIFRERDREGEREGEKH